MEGAAGKDIYFRPKRLRPEDLAPLELEMTVAASQQARPGRLLNVSESGASFELDNGFTLNAGDTVRLAIRADGDHVYEGEARVEWQKPERAQTVVGVSLLGPQVDVDEVLQLRELLSQRQDAAKLAQRAWRSVKNDTFKAIAGEFSLFLGDAADDLLHMERSIAPQVLYGERTSSVRKALERWMTEDFVPGVVDYAARLDASLAEASDAEREGLKMYGNRHLQKYLMQAPWMHRAFHKPLGYAGDFEVMNFVYARELVGQNLFAKALHRAFLEVPAAEAVRARKDLIKAQLADKLAATAKKGLTRILSVAAGPAQELYELLTETEIEQDVEIVLFDQEPGALAHAHRRLTSAISTSSKNRVKVTYLRDSVKRLLVDPGIFAEHGKFDAIVCSGFFDYLRVNSAIRVTKTFVRYLEPGGSTYIGNMVPENPSRWLMEHHLDWKLIYRSREQMVSFARTAAPNCDVRIVEERTRINPFLAVTAPG
ncbi:MAG TPA: PilZ domain-containing protein [Labilithrix sp.]|nr:PilZ domain-containing protein [Labilithrix sp.]